MVPEVKEVPITESTELDFVRKFSHIFFRNIWGCSSEEEVNQYLEDLFLVPGTKMFAAYSQHEQVGFALSEPVSRLYRDQVCFPALECSETGIMFEEGSKVVSLIGVSPYQWGRGVGFSLLDAILKDSQSENVPQLYASCLSGMKGSSYRLFKKKGFQVLAICDHFYSSSNPAAFVMKEL
jgi:ribosomal protein S18 acetylase RimI-like enzyme